MTFIRDIVSLFENKRIEVEIDPLLLPHLKTADKVTTNRSIIFNLYRLIYHIGTIQTRRFATSNRLKFLDKVDLLEKIYINTNEFRVKINEIREVNGSETLTSVSEDFGIGISVVIAESLFSTQRSTIQKIYGTGRRPDWKCQLEDNRILVVEAKGATNIATSERQKVRALDQKTRVPGDIQVASLTILNEDNISTNRYLDPPIENSEMSSEMQNHILRAGHYASVFSFLGNSKLSKYYSQMRKRLQGRITPYEQDRKDAVFRDLRTNDPIIYFENKEFTGSFYKIDNQKFLFVGVDKELLSYSGFIEFKEYENDSDTLIRGNHYNLFKDGVLIIEIEQIKEFDDIIRVDRIQNYQNKITVSDIDEMNEISFSKYFIHLLERNGFDKIREEIKIGDFRIDLTAEYYNETYYFEFKIYKSKRLNRNVIEQVNFHSRNIPDGKFVLVTNGLINDENIENSRIVLIDRNGLKKIANNYRNLIELINTTPNEV